jgi:hypothetical protein
MKRFVAIASLLALLLVAPAEAKVRKISLTSSVAPGQRAQLVIDVRPRGRCTFSITSGAARTGGRITWIWQVPATAKPGVIPLRVNCGRRGTFRDRLVVRAAVDAAWPMPDTPRNNVARFAVCNQAPGRVREMYGVEIIQARDFFAGRSDAMDNEANLNRDNRADCAFAVKGVIDDALWYFVSVRVGKGCNYLVTTRLMNPNGISVPSRPLLAETYTASCASLGAA